MFLIPENLQNFDDLGDFCKGFEKLETSRCAIPGEVLMARLDGRSFHSVTRSFNKPYDTGFIQAMTHCAERLMQEFHADVAYVQSDEISLAWSLKGELSQFPFGGKFHKINSVCAAYCSSVFNHQYIGTRLDKLAVFDCRSWAVASKITAAQTFVWRQRDAQRNAINMVAHHVFGHKKLEGVSTAVRLQMLKDNGTDWAVTPANFMSGTFITSEQVLKELSPEALATIPEAHRPTGPVKRKQLIFNSSVLELQPDPIKFLFSEEEKVNV